MLSDIDIKNSIKNNEIEISPLIEDYIQPSSVDLRVGSEFRVFENHKYSHIDPKAQQDDLTSLVTATIEEPFVLHPCLLYTSPSPRDVSRSRMPSSA